MQIAYQYCTVRIVNKTASLAVVLQQQRAAGFCYDYFMVPYNKVYTHFGCCEIAGV